MMTLISGEINFFVGKLIDNLNKKRSIYAADRELKSNERVPGMGRYKISGKRRRGKIRSFG